MKFKSKAEALPASPPAPTTIHNHAPSAFGAVFSKVLAAIAGLVFLWFAGIFLFAKLGVRHPDTALARTILFGVGIFLLVSGTSIIADRFFTRWVEFQKDMREKDIQYARYRQMLLQSAVADTRPAGNDRTRLNALILQIMEESYNYLVKNGRFRGAWRPWSRRNAGAMILLALGETEPAGEARAVKAKQFLVRHEVVVDEQVNMQRNASPIWLPSRNCSTHRRCCRCPPRPPKSFRAISSDAHHQVDHLR